MRGRWRVLPARPRRRSARPGSCFAAATGRPSSGTAPCSSSPPAGRARLARLGPDIMDDPPDLDGDGRPPAGGRPERARSARRSSTRVSSPGSATCGRPRRSSRRGVSPWTSAWRSSTDDELRSLLEAACDAHARAGAEARRLPPGGAALPPLLDARSARGRRARGTDRILVPALSGRNRAAPARNGRRHGQCGPSLARSPPCAARRSAWARSSSSGPSSRRGAELPVALEEHAGPDRPTLYEYRPLVGAFVEERAGRLGQREDARDALERAEGRAGGRDLRPARTRTSASGRTRRCAGRSSFRCSCDRARRAAASTGTTRPSSRPTRSSSARSSASAAPTARSHRSSG